MLSKQYILVEPWKKSVASSNGQFVLKYAVLQLSPKTTRLSINTQKSKCPKL